MKGKLMKFKRLAELIVLLLLIIAAIYVCGINKKAHTPQESPKPDVPAESEVETPSAEESEETPVQEEEPSKPSYENYVPPKKLRELRYTKETYDLASTLVSTFRYPPDNSAQIVSDTLLKYEETDYEMGEMWRGIMEYWAYANLDMPLNYNVLPDGLPEDDSMCIVVLGYRLEDDGSMSEELVERLKVGLASAEKYPNAIVAVTGGGTSRGSNATEADSMAHWLTEHGVDPARIIIENKALTTGDNAVLTLEILRNAFPQVNSVAVVSSSYHIPEGCMVFREVTLIDSYCYGTEALNIVSNACCDVGPSTYGTINDQSQYVWSLANPTY